MAGLSGVHALVRGYVQGVGFRYFVQDRAESLGLAGYVRNMPDGRAVEVVAEGPKDALEALVRALARGPRGSVVEGVDTHWGPATGKFSSFEVRH